MLTAGYELVHQTMGAEAKATVWEAERLARRHGHTRVTPLHLASAVLTNKPAAGGLLMSSSTHHHEDLLRCLDAAISRLPVACPPPPDTQVLAPPLPMSNALIATLKRALQRHNTAGLQRGRRPQRADVKIELEHLIISMMDDPSVYRAMTQTSNCPRVRPNVMENGSSPERSNQPRATGTVVCCHTSGDHPSQARTGEGFVSFAAQSATTARVPSWLRHHQNAILRPTLQVACPQQKFANLSATNFKILCDVLEMRIPWHKNIASGIASTLLWCRSSMTRRATSWASSTTWLFFEGLDVYGKRVMARELSNLIFGSYSEFFLVNSSDNIGTGNLTNQRKRSRNGNNTYVMSRLLEGIQENPHRVMFINGIDQLDYESEIAIKKLIASGRIMGCNGSEIVGLEDAIVVFSTEEKSSSRPVASSTLLNPEFTIAKKCKDMGVESCRFSFDLNSCVEDVREEEIWVGDNVGIKSVVDGVFHFD